MFTARRITRVDGRPVGALRATFGHGAGGHLELRDVRIRPAVAHLRSGQDPWRLVGALGPGGRVAEAAERQEKEFDMYVLAVQSSADKNYQKMENIINSIFPS